VSPHRRTGITFVFHAQWQAMWCPIFLMPLRSGSCRVVRRHLLSLCTISPIHVGRSTFCMAFATWQTGVGHVVDGRTPRGVRAHSTWQTDAGRRLLHCTDKKCGIDKRSFPHREPIKREFTLKTIDYRLVLSFCRTSPVAHVYIIVPAAGWHSFGVPR